jgi:hypothetical protein
MELRLESVSQLADLVALFRRSTTKAFQPLMSAQVVSLLWAEDRPVWLTYRPIIDALRRAEGRLRRWIGRG